MINPPLTSGTRPVVRHAFSILLLLATVVRPAAAQEKAVVPVGTLILVYSRDQPPLFAEFVGVAGDTVLVRPQCTDCGRIGLARASLDSVTMRVHDDTRRQRAMTYGVASALVAGVALIVAVERASHGCRDGVCGIVFAPFAALVGGVLGGMIGWFTDPGAWARAELPIA